MRHLALLVLAGSFVLAACGGDDASSQAVGDSIVLPAKKSTITTVDAASEASQVVADVATATTAAEQLVVPIELDPCLVGAWNVSEESIGLLVGAALLPVADLSLVAGAFTVTLGDGGTAAGDAEFTAAFAFGATAGEADVAWAGSGTWSTFDDVVSLSLDEQRGGLIEARLDGVVQPNSAAEVDLPFGGGPYTCTETRLEVTGTTGTTTVPLILER